MVKGLTLKQFFPPNLIPHWPLHNFGFQVENVDLGERKKPDKNITVSLERILKPCRCRIIDAIM
jgi:hypothetical protein